MHERNKNPTSVIILLLVSFAASLYHLESQSIWFDEGWSAYAAIQPTVSMAVESDKTNPPLYYAIINAAARVLGDSEFALRWVSTAFNLLATALAYQLARKLFTPETGVIAVLLMAVSPLMWWASQEARMYTLLAALLLVCATAWHQLWVKGRARWYWWFVLGGAELALLYAHNTGPVVTIWLNAVTLLLVIIRISYAKSVHRRRFPLFTPIIYWSVSQAVVGLLWLPYFINRFLRLTEANSAVTSTTPFTLETLGRLWQVVWTGSWIMVGQEPLLVALSTVIFGIVLVLLMPWRQANARWLMLHVIVLTTGLWLALSLLGNEIHGRYLVMITPLLLIVIAAGIAQLVNSTTRRNALLPSSILVTGVFVVIFAGAVHYTTTNRAYQHDDARSMVQYYADHMTGHDSVLMWSYADRYELAYYWDRLGVKANRITLPEGADLDTVLPLLPASGDVALNVWYTQRADYRGMMSCLLEDGTVNEAERFDVYGMTNLLFRTPTLKPPSLRPFDANLSMGQLTAIGDIRPAPADRSICLPIQFLLTEATTVDLKVAVTLLNRFNQPVAHADAIFADRVQRLSSQVPAETFLTAYARLRLPYAAPADEYMLAIRVYDELQQPSGYSLTLPDGQTRGDAQVGLIRTNGSNWANVQRTSGLPVSIDMPVPNSEVKLTAHDLQGGTYRNGDIINLALLWEGQGKIPELQLAATDNSWRVGISAPDYPNRDVITLDWRQVQIPLEASSGTAELQFPDGTPIASMSIAAIPALYDPPPTAHTVNAHIPAVGTLVGYGITGDVSNRNQPFALDLVWRAEQPTPTSYTIFVQLVADDGSVLAQSDAQPAQGTRPTTGWRRNEYILDTHTVTFHSDARPATASLIVGMYDAATGKRVLLDAVTDHVTLDSGITVR